MRNFDAADTSHDRFVAWLNSSEVHRIL